MAPIQTLTGVNVYFFTLLLLQLQVDDVLPSYFRAERMKEGARSTYLYTRIRITAAQSFDDRPSLA